jgi:hypothetical protein
MYPPSWTATSQIPAQRRSYPRQPTEDALVPRHPYGPRASHEGGSRWPADQQHRRCDSGEPRKRMTSRSSRTWVVTGSVAHFTKRRRTFRVTSIRRTSASCDHHRTVLVNQEPPGDRDIRWMDPHRRAGQPVGAVRTHIDHHRGRTDSRHSALRPPGRPSSVDVATAAGAIAISRSRCDQNLRVEHASVEPAPRATGVAREPMLPDAPVSPPRSPGPRAPVWSEGNLRSIITRVLEANRAVMSWVAQS